MVGNCQSVHRPRNVHVGEQGVDVGCTAFKDRKSLVYVLGFNDLEPGFLDRGASDNTHDQLVLDDDDNVHGLVWLGAHA